MTKNCLHFAKKKKSFPRHELLCGTRNNYLIINNQSVYFVCRLLWPWRQVSAASLGTVSAGALAARTEAPNLGH